MPTASTRCDYCKVYLCARADRNCWKEWHSKPTEHASDDAVDCAGDDDSGAAAAADATATEGVVGVLNDASTGEEAEFTPLLEWVAGDARDSYGL